MLASSTTTSASTPWGWPAAGSGVLVCSVSLAAGLAGVQPLPGKARGCCQPAWLANPRPHRRQPAGELRPKSSVCFLRNLWEPRRTPMWISGVLWSRGWRTLPTSCNCKTFGLQALSGFSCVFRSPTSRCCWTGHASKMDGIYSSRTCVAFGRTLLS